MSLPTSGSYDNVDEVINASLFHFGRNNVGVNKVVADKEQWLISMTSERVRKAVTIIELCWMPAPLAILSVSVTSDLDLAFRHRFDNQSKPRDDFLEYQQGIGIIVPIDDEICLQHTTG